MISFTDHGDRTNIMPALLTVRVGRAWAVIMTAIIMIHVDLTWRNGGR